MSDEHYHQPFEEAKRRLLEHPGYVNYCTRRALYGTIVHIFRPNFDQLMRLLDALVDEVNAELLGCDVETARAHPIHEMRRQP